MPIDSESFKHAMRRLAAGVTLITTEAANGTRSGMTATAVCSVSAEPPTILCCINRRNSSYQTVIDAQVFAVNVLAFDDRALADEFARPISSAEKFSHGLWTRLETPAPVLESALASFDCRVSHHVEVGTHGILFGEIQAVNYRAVSAKPLLYAQGAYGRFSALSAGPEADGLWIPTWHDQSY